MDFDSLRAKYKGYSDEEILGALQATKYPEYSVDEIKAALNWTPIKRSAFAAVNDTVIEGANAVAGGVKAVGDFIAPGNAVSSFIDENIIKAGEAKQSDAVKAEKARLASEVQAADGIGGEIGAALGYVARNPVLAAAQAAGSFVTPGAAIKGAGMLGRAAGIGATAAGLTGGVAAGAALSGGDAAGQAYELAKRAGASEEEAIAAARKASVIPAAVGGATGAFGAERVFAGAGGFKGGMLARGLKTGASEAAQEAVEEGVTQYEAQRAAQPFDPSIDPSKGVASAATLGAALGGITGAGVGMLSGKAEAKRDLVPDILAAPDVDTAIEFSAEAVFGDSKKEPTTAPGAKAPGEGIPFEADPIFAGKPVIGPAQSPLPAFGSKQAADIWIGQSDGLGKYQAVQAGDRWQVTLTPQAADETARQNIERWAARAEPMTEDDARWTARAALQQENRKLTPIPLPDGSGWTVVPSAWVQAPGLGNYIDEAMGAAAVEADRNAAIRAQALAPMPATQSLPEIPGGATMERTLGNITLDAEAARAAAQKAADLERLPVDAVEQNVQQAAVQRAATVEAPTAMELALRRAMPAPAAAAPADQVTGNTGETAVTPPEPRIVERTPDMRPMSRLGAETQAAKIPGAEVVRIPNRQPGKFAYTVLLQENTSEPVADVAAPAGLAVGPADGRGADAGGSQRDLGQLADDAGGQREPVANAPVRSSEPAVPVGAGDAGNAALTVGATFESAGKTWTVTERTDRMVRAQDADGNKRMIAVGSKAWAQITAAPAAPQPTPAPSGGAEATAAAAPINAAAPAEAAGLSGSQGDTKPPVAAAPTTTRGSAKPAVIADGKSRAISGGQVGINGYEYKGGQFLPSTMAAPGKWKVKGKWVNSGKEQTAPGEWSYQPTPFSRSIYSMIGSWLSIKDGKAQLFAGANGQGIRDNSGNPITPLTEIRPGVKGVLGKQDLTLGELIDAYNNGQRWFDVQPDAETITTRSADAVATKDSGGAADDALRLVERPASLGERLQKRKTDLAAEVKRNTNPFMQRLDALRALRSCLNG